jgi:hypothetical protein
MFKNDVLLKQTNIIQVNIRTTEVPHKMFHKNQSQGSKDKHISSFRPLKLIKVN